METAQRIVQPKLAANLRGWVGPGNSWLQDKFSQSEGDRKSRATEVPTVLATQTPRNGFATYYSNRL